MKNLNSILALVLLISCESDIKLQDTDFEVGVISGKISLTNILTDELVTDNEAIEIELMSIGADPSNIPIEVSKKLTGYRFEFGPLNYGTYSVLAKYVDTTIGVDYLGEVKVELSEVVNREVLEISLEPKNQTIILGELLNQSEGPVAGADFFLYNDTTFLKQFKGSGGFVDQGVSNKLGRAVFSGHQEGEYYVLGRLIINEDTIFSKTEGFVPTTILPSKITKVQSQFNIEE